MAVGRTPILVFRSARPGESFGDWLYARLSPPMRRTLAAGIMAFLPHWGGAICAVRLGKRHGPRLFELRLRFEQSWMRPSSRGDHSRERRVKLSAFFCTERDALVLLSGAVVNDEAWGSRAGTPGLGDARWRVRELDAAMRGGEDALSRLALDAVCGIKGESPSTPRPRPRTSARSAAHPSMVDFRQTYREVQAEAVAEGPRAWAQLCQAEDRFRLASAVLQSRRRSGLTQRQLAVAACLPQGKISRLEAGIANPTLATIGLLARALDIELRVGRPSWA